jgi:hypothetical protein
MYIDYVLRVIVYMLFVSYKSTRAHGYLPYSIYRILSALFIQAMLNWCSIMVVAADHSLSTLAHLQVSQYEARWHKQFSKQYQLFRSRDHGMCQHGNTHGTYVKLFLRINDILPT